MWELIWLDSAVDDLKRLRNFIAQNNKEAAKRAAQAIQEAAEYLRTHPLIGKPILDLPNYRDFLIRFGVGGYCLRYRIHEEQIFIVHLRHYRENDFIYKH